MTPGVTGSTLARGSRWGTVTVGDGCTACGACLATCGPRALLPAPRRPVVAAERCTGCLDCVEICPAGAIEVEE